MCCNARIQDSTSLSETKSRLSTAPGMGGQTPRFNRQYNWKIRGGDVGTMFVWSLLNAKLCCICHWV